MPKLLPATSSPSLNRYRERCDEADDRCNGYTQRFLDGEISELELRKLILAEITEVEVVPASIPRHYTPPWREEAEIRLEDILVRRFMETGKEAFFQPVRALFEKTTYIGAARNLCFQALATVNRDINASRRRFGETLVEDTADNNGSNNPLDEAVDSAEDTSINLLGWGLDSETTDNLLDLTRAIRTGNQREATTRGLMSMHNLPDPIRLPVEDRRRLKALMDEDSSLAHLSVVYVHDLRQKQRPRTARPDEAMMSLWDDYTLTDLERIRELSPRVAEAVVLHAVSDRARPSRSVIREFTRAVVQAGNGRGWRSMANAVARVFIAVECEALAACDSNKADVEGIEQRLAGREMVLATEDVVYRRLFSEFRENELGNDIEEVKARLNTLLDKCNGLEEILRIGLGNLQVSSHAA